MMVVPAVDRDFSRSTNPFSRSLTRPIATMNEEKTIGLVIKRIKGPLMDRVPLIDQMVVIDDAREENIRRELGRQG